MVTQSANKNDNFWLAEVQEYFGPSTPLMAEVSITEKSEHYKFLRSVVT